MSKMNFNNPIPRTGMPTFHESSAQRSVRDSDAVPRIWSKTLDVTKQMFRTTLALEELQRQVRRLRLRAGAGDPATPENYPFQLYAGSGWLKWKVRTGEVITTGNPITPTNVDVEFSISSGVSHYWFYIDLNTSPNIVASGSTPAWDSKLIPVGYVDTFTKASSSKAIPHQWARGNQYAPCP